MKWNSGQAAIVHYGQTKMKKAGYNLALIVVCMLSGGCFLSWIKLNLGQQSPCGSYATICGFDFDLTHGFIVLLYVPCTQCSRNVRQAGQIVFRL